IVGEIALGILLGPSILGFYLNIRLFDPGVVSTFAGLGAIFLLFLIGLESDFRAIYTRKNVAVATGGVLLPFAVGFLTAYFLVSTALLFLGVGMAVGLYFFRRVVVRIQVSGLKLGLKHGGFIIAMAVTFLYAFVAEIIGLSAIVGAFLAGTMFANTPLREDFT